MYAAIATRVRGPRSDPRRPDLKIGPCARAWTLYPTGHHRDLSRQFCETLMQYCRDHDAPMDFYSWHQYGGLQAQTGPSTLTIWFGGNAWTYLESARRIRNALQTYGFGTALSICNEWNSLCNQDNPYHNTNLAAAFTACVLMYLDYADVYMQNYWPMVNTWGLFDNDANYTKEAYAYKAFSLLRADTPRRLAVTRGLSMDLNAATADNFAIMAGKSEDGATIQILIADEDQKWIKAPGATDWLSYSGGYWSSNAVIDSARPHYDVVRLTVDNLAPVRNYTVTWRTIDSNGIWVESAPETYSTGCDNRSIILQKDWVPPAVCLVRVRLVGPPPTPPVPGDFDCDGDLDQEDFGHFQVCLTGPGVKQIGPTCSHALLDGDIDVDQDDFAIFQGCLSGANVPADPTCAD